MKLKHIILPLIIIAGFYFSACQKDFTPNEIIARADSTAAIGDSIYLDKVKQIDTAVISGVTYIDSILFVCNYDVQKRLSYITVKSLANLNDTFILNKFYYNANDSLPFQAEDFSMTIGGAAVITYYFFYDNTGRLVKDSINNFGGNGEHLSRTLSYSGNKIFALLYSSNNNPTFSPVEKDTFTLDARMNIISLKYYIKTTAPSFELATKSDIIFDNGINPSFKVPSLKVFRFTSSSMDHNTSSSSCPGVNNIVTGIRYNYPFTGSGTINNPISQFSVFNTYYQNGLLQNTRSSDRESSTFFYKPL